MPLTQDRHLAGRDPRPVTVVLRYDDFSNGSPDDLDRFLLEAASDLDLALTVAALPLGDGPEESRHGPAGHPEPLLERKASLLAPFLASGRIELAQHGLDHEPVGRDPRGRPAELAGLPADEQRERIERGLEILERATGMRPRSFVPPWNRFDAGTVAALRDLGFSVLSAGREAPSLAAVSRDAEDALALIPATVPPHGLRVAVSEAHARGGGLIVALLHPYDFAELEKPWARFDRAGFRAELEWLAARREVRTATLGGLPDIEPHLGRARFAAFGRFHASPVSRCVPARVPGSLDRPLTSYPEADDLRRLSARRVATAAAIALVIAVAAAGAGWLVARAGDAAGLGVGVPVGLGALALGSTWRAFRGDGPFFRGLAITWALACSALAAWLP